MHLVGKAVDCINISSMPDEGETILDYFDISKFLHLIRSVNIWFRDVRDCPFGRGNWLIDIELKDGCTFCIKIPKEMTSDQVDFWIKPLLDKLKEKLN